MIIAAILAVAAVALTLIYVSHARTTKQSVSTGTKTVLVASRDIPIGTTGAQLAHGGWLTTMKFSTQSTAADAVSDPTQLLQLVAIQPTYRGEQIVARRFGTTQQEGVLATLKGTERIVQLPGDANQLLAGTLKEGNRVDVVGSIKVPESGQTHFASTFLRDLLVVSAADKPSSSSDSVNSGSTTLSVQLELTPAQEQRLFWLEKNADWSLLLRPSTGAKDQTVPPSSAASLLAGASAR